MSYLFETIALNNTAVHHLASGSCYEGYELLKYALDHLNDAAEERNRAQQHDSNNPAGESSEDDEGNPNTKLHGDALPISYDWVDCSSEEWQCIDPHNCHSSNNPSNNETCRSASFLSPLVVKMHVDDTNGIFAQAAAHGGTSLVNFDDSNLRWAIVYK